MPPGASANSYLFITTPITPEQEESIDKATHALWLIGRLYYRDAFGAAQWSNFRCYSKGEEWRMQIMIPDARGGNEST